MSSFSDEFVVIEAGRRLGVRTSESFGDWFVSHSPRNDNSYAEGPWEAWIELAVRILLAPGTQSLRSDLYEVVAELVEADHSVESPEAELAWREWHQMRGEDQ